MKSIGKVRPWNRFQLKIAVSYIFIIALMLGLLNTYPAIVSQNIIFQTKRGDMVGQANKLSAALADIDTLSEARVSWVLQNWEENAGFRTLVTDAAGRVLYDNSSADSVVGRLLLLPEAVRALKGFDVFHSRRDGGLFRAKAVVPVMIRGQAAGAVYLYSEDAEQGMLLYGLQQNIAVFSLLVFLLVVLLSAWLSSLLTRRLGRLSRAMRQVREGEFGHQAPVRGRDELAQLEQNFNLLSARLLQTERQRRQFVSDASHELKTPLASMRLLADSVLQTADMPSAQAREFVGDMRDEIDRLTRMTDKLLQLTRLDAALPQGQPTDLGAVAAGVCKAAQPLANHKGVALTVAAEDGCVVLAEADDCYQIVYNLVDNAIKYNTGGGRVTAALNRTDQTVTLTVEDNGSGIPAQELENIFDRFYRVDKAREQGGVGLGLSIVEMAVKRCGGEISVVSEIGGGSTFTVVFPAMNPNAAKG